MDVMQDSWTRFSIGSRSSPNCLPLREVGHVTHVESALEILADGFFRTKPVSDGVGGLNSMRVGVLFTSPYDWGQKGHGSRFGNIMFIFQWTKLIAGKNSYWISAKQHFRLLRPRILITSRKYDCFKPYTPESQDGPWWFDQKSKQHFWNSRYCIEFLLENPMLMVKAAKELRFVAGHPTQCPAGSRCLDQGHDKPQAAMRMLAGMCFFGTLNVVPHLWKTEDGQPTPALRFAWKQVKGLVPERWKWKGSVRSASPAAKALARAVMGARYRQDTEEQEQLLGLFAGPRSAMEALASVVEDPLGSRPRHWRGSEGCSGRRIESTQTCRFQQKPEHLSVVGLIRPIRSSLKIW